MALSYSCFRKCRLFGKIAGLFGLSSTYFYCPGDITGSINRFTTANNYINGFHFLQITYNFKTLTLSPKLLIDESVDLYSCRPIGLGGIILV